MSAREGGTRLQWLEHGREENMRNGDGMAADAFEKQLGGVGQRGNGGRSAWARPCGGGRRRTGGPGTVVSSSGRSATSPDRRT
jgi:hypothetical protein